MYRFIHSQRDHTALGEFAQKPLAGYAVLHL
jgi:hypothetical protein